MREARKWPVAPALIGLTAIAAIAAFSYLREPSAGDGGQPLVTIPTGQATVQRPGDVASVMPMPGIERSLLLHAISLGARSTARISMAGVPEREVGVGDRIADGITVAAIEEQRVTLDVGGRKLVLTLDRSGKPGDRSGLDPEPVTPMPELPAAEIVRRQAQSKEKVELTPEEKAAGLSQL